MCAAKNGFGRLGPCLGTLARVARCRWEANNGLKHLCLSSRDQRRSNAQQAHTLDPLIAPSHMSLKQPTYRIATNQQVQEGLNAFVGSAQTFERHQWKRKGGDPLSESYHLKSSIQGRLIAVKDNICTRDKPTTCASAILRNHKSPFDATVIQRLKAAGALINGKTNLDEFGMGSHSIYSYHGRVRSPFGEDVSAGGSSGGSAVAVATDQCWAALGTDTGGSVRLPAAYTGTIGFKPSYGMVSRLGVTAYANSLDTVGIIARSSEIARKVFHVVRGHDINDPTSVSDIVRSKLDTQPARCRSHFRIGVPSEYNITELDPIVREAWVTTLARLQEANHKICFLSLPTTQVALSAYYIIAPAEASSNLAKYDGVRFGTKNSIRQETQDVLFAVARGEGLGEEVKRRILLGSYSLSAAAMDNYFIKAQKARRLVRDDFNRVFSQRHPLLDRNELTSPNETTSVDVIISPTTPSLPPNLYNVQSAAAIDTYSDDIFTVPASLAGLPAISIPIPIDSLVSHPRFKTTGLQIISQYGDDDFLLDVAESIEDLFR